MNDPTIARTPNPDCGACLGMRIHDDAEWRTWHPFAGHGFTKEQGWSHPLLPAGGVLKQDAPVAGISPVERALIFHGADGDKLLCGATHGFMVQERLEVTCEKCLEILNR